MRFRRLGVLAQAAFGHLSVEICKGVCERGEIPFQQLFLAVAIKEILDEHGWIVVLGPECGDEDVKLKAVEVAQVNEALQAAVLAVGLPLREQVVNLLLDIMEAVGVCFVFGRTDLDPHTKRVHEELVCFFGRKRNIRPQPP